MTPEELNYNIRALMKGTADLYGAIGSATQSEARANGFNVFGDAVDCSADPSTELKTHYGSRRGTKKKARTASSNNEYSYSITLAEFSSFNMGFLLGHDPNYNYGSEASDNSRSAISATGGTAWAFATTNADPEKWYEVLDASGNHVMNLTALTIATKVEGTDFHVDYELGMVRFAAAESTDLTPTITAAEITSSSKDFMKRIKPGQKFVFEGFYRIVWFDEDDDSKVVLDHEPFLGRLSVEAGPTIGDDFSNFKIKLDVLDGGFAKIRN